MSETWLPILCLYLAALLVLVQILRYLLTMTGIMGLSVHTPRFQFRERSDCPPYVEELFRPKEQELFELGFRFSHAFMFEEIALPPEIKSCGFQYHHPGTQAFAVLSVSSDADGVMPYVLAFISLLKNGQYVETVNGRRHLMLGTIPGTMIEDAYAATLAEHWQFHLRRISRYSPQELKEFRGSHEEIDENMQSLNRILQESIQRWLQDGRLRVDKNNGLRFKARAALRLARQMLQGLPRVNSLKKRIRAVQPAVAIPLEIEVQNYFLHRHLLNQRRRSMGVRIALLFATMLLFTAAFKFVFSLDWTGILILLGVILLHESGHMLAMSLAGYKNLAMFFVPLLGAVAMGSPRGVSPGKKVLVSMAGPVPGILLALALVFVPGWFGVFPLSSPLVTQVVLYSLFLNYFNLIPILPLDGGQILDTIIFSRFRALQLAFIGISVAGLAIIAILLDVPMFLVLAGIIPFGYITQTNQQRFLLRLKKELPQGEPAAEKDLVVAAFALFRKEPAKVHSLQRKFQIVRYAEDNLSSTPASAPTVATTLLAYGALISLPVISILFPKIPAGLLSGMRGDPCAAVRRSAPAMEETAIPRRFARIAKEEKSLPLIGDRYCFSGAGGASGLSASWFVSRLVALYGPPDADRGGLSYTISDLDSGIHFRAAIRDLRPLYEGRKKDKGTIRAIHLFERVLARTRPADCSLETEVDFNHHAGEDAGAKPETIERIRYRIGSRGGVPFLEISQQPPATPPPSGNGGMRVRSSH